MKTILALDLGTHTGYAHNAAPGMRIGTWNLATPKEVREWGKSRLTRRSDPRVTRFCEILSGLPAFDVVVYEDVQFASSTYQVQLWASLRASVWLCSKHRHIDCVPVATLKKFATGHGGATKPMMETALRREHPAIFYPDMDDNAIDAAWLWLWAKQNLGRI